MQVPSLVRELHPTCGGAAWLKKKSFLISRYLSSYAPKILVWETSDNIPSATAVDSASASHYLRKTIQEYLVNWEIVKDVVSFQIKKNECSA